MERVDEEVDDAGPVDRLDRIIEAFAGVYSAHDAEFPEEPLEQLWAAIGAVFDSWNNRRAIEYRRLHGIADDLGTGVTVQAMVFGNRGDDCATGVAFTRDPSTGAAELYGEYLLNAQGEDVVAGTHTPRPIHGDPDQTGSGMAEVFPEAFDQLSQVCGVLERHFRNMQDLEFTIQNGKLFLLQTRAGKRSGPCGGSNRGRHGS